MHSKVRRAAAGSFISKETIIDNRHKHETPLEKLKIQQACNRKTMQQNSSRKQQNSNINAPEAVERQQNSSSKQQKSDRRAAKALENKQNKSRLFRKSNGHIRA